MSQQINTRKINIEKYLVVLLPACLILSLFLSAFTPPDPPKGCAGRCKDSVTPARTGPGEASARQDGSAVVHPGEAVHSGTVTPARVTVHPAATVPDKKGKPAAPDQGPLTTEKGEMPASSPTLVTLYV